MSECIGCQLRSEMVEVLKEQLQVKDRQIEALLQRPGGPIVELTHPIETGPVENTPSEADLRKQMADYVDGDGNPMVFVEDLSGVRVAVRLEEYQRVQEKLDFELSGGRLA